MKQAVFMMVLLIVVGTTVRPVHRVISAEARDAVGLELKV